MHPLNLPGAANDTYLRIQASGYHATYRAIVMDLDHLPVADISARLIDGQVTVDLDGEDATRACSFAAFDPSHDLGFDSADSSSGVWFLDRMVQVIAEIEVPFFGTVACPLFTGPIRKFRRKGALVTLDCVGKDIFIRRAWPRINIPAGTLVTDAIRMVLEELGEAHFRWVATSSERTAAKITVDRNMIYSPWGWARVMAASIGARLFYDGAGRATLLPERPDQPIFTFRDGDGGMVLSDPDTGGDYSEMANIVRAEGMVATSGANPYWEEFVAANSPLHPTNLTRNGKPITFGVVVQRDSITSQAIARRVSKDELARRQMAVYSTAFDSLPLFPLEEGDVARLITEDNATTFVARKFSFGLSADAVMPIGYERMVAPKLAMIRRI